MTYLEAYIKLSGDDTLLFSHVYGTDKFASEINNDIIRIQNCGYHCKMPFNLNRTKPAHKVIFPHKKLKILFALIFNLTAWLFLKQHLKSTWDLAQIRGLRLTIT